MSQLEREMVFRTEMGFYFSFYKKITIEFQDSLSSAVWSITNDSIIEYPHTINGFHRFNILPELITGIVFRIFDWLINYLGIEMKQCWLVNRGVNLDVIESCEGLSDPFYFYLNFIFILNGLVAAFVYLNGYLLCNHNTFGGIISVVAFAFNHGQATRAQWTPPLRESFAYPIYLILHYYITKNVQSKARTKPVIIITLVTLLILSWQFAQFILLTQLVSLYLTLKSSQLRRCNGNYLNYIFKCNLCSIVLSYVFMIFNSLIITSLYFTFIIANLFVDQIVIRYVIKHKYYHFSKIKQIILHIILVSIFTLTFKVLLSFVFSNNDDGHIWLLLYSKLTNYKDFHTMLYTCAPEFDLLSFEDIKSITKTLLLPYSILVIILSPKLLPKKLSIEFNLIQTLLFMPMALLIMRLKLLFVPQLCIMTSLLCYGWRSNLKRIAIFALLISLMSVQGILNIKDQRNSIGEYFNEPLEQMIKWVNTSTHQKDVFAGKLIVKDLHGICYCYIFNDIIMIPILLKINITHLLIILVGLSEMVKLSKSFKQFISNKLLSLMIMFLYNKF